jgi:hypothetical protein
VKCVKNKAGYVVRYLEDQYSAYVMERYTGSMKEIRAMQKTSTSRLGEKAD